MIVFDLKVTNYFDITLNLNDGSYRSYRNPNEETTIFTSIQTTRHQSLKKFHDQLKKNSILTSSKNIFQESAIYYEKWLKNSGYKSKLQYQQLKENNQNKKNIGRIFIILTSKHFSPSHKFVKIFNKNTIKHSYS